MVVSSEHSLDEELRDEVGCPEDDDDWVEEDGPPWEDTGPLGAGHVD